jgi:uncharacterized protein DUF5677
LLQGDSLNKALEEWNTYHKRAEEYLRKLGKKPSDKRSWSLMKLKDLSMMAGEPYECYYNFLYWSLSNVAHASVLGSFLYYGVSCPSDEFGETGRALQISFDCYWRIVFTVNKIFELGFEGEIKQVRGKYINLANK